MSDQLRRLRVEENRSPIDHAFYAFVALSNDDKEAMCARFNALQKGRAHPDELVFKIHERNQHK